MKRYIPVAFLAIAALGLSACDKSGDTAHKKAAEEKGMVKKDTKEKAKKAFDETKQAVDKKDEEKGMVKKDMKEKAKKTFDETKQAVDKKDKKDKE